MSADTQLLIDLVDLVDPVHTAVMVIDMQNDFCAPGGWTDKVVKRDIGLLGPVAENIQTLIDAARASQAPVFWVRADYSSNIVPDPMLARSKRLGIKEDCCGPGSWGADWFGVAPKPGEPVFTKHCYSGFSNADLDSALKESGVRTVLFAGVQSHVCVESTLRDAHSKGYYCVVPEECVASHTAPAHEVMLSTVNSIFGVVVPLEKLLTQWKGAGSCR